MKRAIALSVCSSKRAKNDQPGVPVYGVGIGTTDGAVVRAEGWAMRVRLEEAPLEKLAELTGAQYFRSGDAARRQRIFDTLGARLTFGRARTTE
ncbi:MAG: hypothetical protein WCA09_07330, partial [Burkholderiales bacterium]